MTTSATGTATTVIGDPEQHLRVWVNDALVSDPTAPSISPIDHGLVVGDGVFETIKVTRDGAFALPEHLARLSRSAAKLGLADPDHARIEEAVAAVIAGRSYEFGRIRITWTGGKGPLGSQAPYGPPLLVVAAEATTPWPSHGTLLTLPWRRSPTDVLAGVKTTSYGGNVRGLAAAHAAGASEGIFVNTEGHVGEGTGSNIFFVFGETVVTPPLSAGILDGITRQFVLDWTDGVIERDVTLAEAQSADEVFLSSSLFDVQPVDRWDDRTWTGPWPVTTRIQQVFAERAAARQS